MIGQFGRSHAPIFLNFISQNIIHLYSCYINSQWLQPTMFRRTPDFVVEGVLFQKLSFFDFSYPTQNPKSFPLQLRCCLPHFLLLRLLLQLFCFYVFLLPLAQHYHLLVRVGCCILRRPKIVNKTFTNSIQYQITKRNVLRL